MQSNIKIFKSLAKECANELKKLSTVIEVAMVGEVPGNAPEPEDLEIAVILKDYSQISAVAQIHRKANNQNHKMSMAIFNSNVAFSGYICFFKDCPNSKKDEYCTPSECGRVKHIATATSFKEKEFFSLPIEILNKSSCNSLFEERRKALGITKIESYKHIKAKCKACGGVIQLPYADKQYYERNPKKLPWYCDNCRVEVRLKHWSRDWNEKIGGFQDYYYWENLHNVKRAFLGNIEFGTPIQLIKSQFKIPKNKLKDALQALKEMATKRINDKKPFFQVDLKSILDSSNLCDAVKCCRWSLTKDDQENVIDIRFDGTEFGHEWVLFNTLSPFLEPDCFIKIKSDEGIFLKWKVSGVGIKEKILNTRVESTDEIDSFLTSYMKKKKHL